MYKKLLVLSVMLPVRAYAADVDVYGQVNKSFVSFNDSKTKESVVVDNDYSSTRIGVKGTEILDNGFKVGVALEYEITSNDSETSMVTDQIPNAQSTPQNTDATFKERVARVTIGADTLGTFAVGKFASATDGVTEIDLGGVQDVMSSAVDRMGGSLRFYDSQNGDYDAVTVGALIDNMDGYDDLGTNGEGNFDQVNGIGYRSPIFSGAQLRATLIQGGDYDVSLRYNAKFGGLRLAAGLGLYVYNDEASNTLASPTENILSHRYSGSLALKHDSGLSASVAVGSITLQNPASGQKDPEFYYTKFGYEWSDYAIAMDYGSYSDIDLDNAGVADTFGVGAQVNLGHGVSTAAFYRNIKGELEDTTKTLEDISLAGVNLRVRF